MSTHLSLYRKWRPQNFSDVVGQKHVVRTLTNALGGGRLTHAYLFNGPRGTGKTTMARLLSKGLNCAQGPTAEPCGTCDPCRHIRDGSFLDVVEIDAASNRGIEEIRELREKIRYAPASGRYKVYILDEVHMLTAEAFNALLKVLEEPPAHALFIFATTAPHRIPATIVSRCQRFDFRPLQEEEVVSRLALIAEAEEIAVERGALTLIARRARGGMRDAEATLDQCISFRGAADSALSEETVAEMLGVVPVERVDAFLEALARGDGPEALRSIKLLSEEGRDFRQFSRDVIERLRGLLEARVRDGSDDDVDGTKGSARGGSSEWTMEQLLSLIERLTAVDGEMRYAEEPRLPLELGVLRWLQPDPGESRQGGGALSGRPPTAEPPGEAGAVAQGEPPGEAPSEGAPRERLDQLDRQLVRVTQSLAGLQREVRRLREGGNGIKSGRDVGARTIQSESVEAQEHPAEASGEAVPKEEASQDSGLTLERVREVWPEGLERLRRRSVRVEAFLREAVPARAEAGGRIELAFSPDHAFHLSNMQQEANRRVAEQVFSQVLGMTVQFGFTPASEKSPASDGASPIQADEGAAALDPGLDAHGVDGAAYPAVEAALKLFGGKIVEVKSDEGEASGM